VARRSRISRFWLRTRSTAARTRSRLTACERRWLHFAFYRENAQERNELKTGFSAYSPRRPDNKATGKAIIHRLAYERQSFDVKKPRRSFASPATGQVLKPL
jgi:hypothetical protein